MLRMLNETGKSRREQRETATVPQNCRPSEEEEEERASTLKEHTKTLSHRVEEADFNNRKSTTGEVKEEKELFRVFKNL